MRLERLTLKGFLRFADEIAIDLTALPPGLVAIVGPNGSGKTTLLEAAPATLYRTFLSRGDLLDYATDSDSVLEVQVATEGAGVYRARVHVDGLRRTSDAILEQLHADGSRTILNDGKVSTFDTVIAQHFPDKSLLLASAFAAQNKAGSFITLDKKARKELFLQLLGLERYQTMSDTARQAAGLVEQARLRLVTERDVLTRDATDQHVAALGTIAEDLERQHDQATGRQRTLQESIARLDAKLAIVAEQAAAFTAAQARLFRIETELATRRAEAQTITHAIERVQADAQRELTHAHTHDAMLLEEVDGLIANNHRLLEHAAAVREAVTVVATCDADLTRLRAEETDARDDSDRLAVVERTLQQRHTALQAVRLKRDAAVEDAETLRTVPCEGAGSYASCRFLTRATEAGTLVPHLDAELAALPQLQTDLQESLTVRQALAARLMDLRSQMRATEERRATATKSAALAEKLAAAAARIEELTARRADLVARAGEADVATKARTTARVRELSEQAQAIVATLDQLVREREAANDDLLGSAEGHRQAIAFTQQVSEARVAWDAGTRAIATLEAGLKDVERRRVELAARRAQAAQVTTRIAALDSDLLDWQTLAKAFGRDGLPVLEIDAAGPTISAYTNDLLATCYGPRFTVDVVTQQAKAGGKGQKEVFTIAVIDNAAGAAVRDIADLSGGEQVIVAEALANAIAIYVNTRSPQPVRTCWRDETTGALDPENAARYLAMLRQVQTLGGFHHVLFITHNPDAAAQADAQIRLTDGHVTIAQPPYAEAA